MACRKRRAVNIKTNFDESHDDEIISKFKKINLKTNEETPKKSFGAKYKVLNGFENNNMNFMILNKQKNILNNVSKVSKKTHTLKKQCDIIGSKSDKINKAIIDIKNEIKEIKTGQIHIMDKLDMIFEYISNQQETTINSNKKDKKEEYNFYG